MQSLETKSSRPRSKSFETETPKNGSRDRDQVSRLHHCCLDTVMIKFLDEFGSIDYCFCTVLVSCTVMYSLEKDTYIRLW